MTNSTENLHLEMHTQQRCKFFLNGMEDFLEHLMYHLLPQVLLILAALIQKDWSK